MNYAKEQTKGTSYESVNTLVQAKKNNRLMADQPQAKEGKSGTPENMVQKDNSGQVPAEGKVINEIGVVALEANLRSAPTTTGRPGQLLKLNTRVQIIKEINGGWYYISTEEGNTGYAASYLIKKGIPEPGSKLHKVENGEGSSTQGIREEIDHSAGFFQQKMNDFNYANQFIANLLPRMLSNDILDTIKAALINFAIGIMAAGLLLAIAAGLGALIGALAGFLVGGAGAVPGAVLGAKIGFEIGLFLLKWIGLGFLIVQGTSLLAKIGVSFGKYVISIWEANGDRKKLEKSADLCANAIKEFLLGVLELVVMLVATMGMARTVGALANTKFGKAIGSDKLIEWVGRRNQQESLKEKFGGKSIASLDIFRITLDELRNLTRGNPKEIVDAFINKMGPSLKKHPLRIEYENKVNGLAETAAKMRQQGFKDEEMARSLSQMRRKLGVQYKDVSPPILREYIYEVNMRRYNDPLGPDFKWLMRKYDGDYTQIIEAATRPNPNVDQLLGGFKEWLIGKLQ
ncbi:MAG TPA: hypothetical protein DDW50_02390 [Firmicutes bacterium]|jgi:hypothetical protein|nr:hypothetical protein [Bacillota bacterium]